MRTTVANETIKTTVQGGTELMQQALKRHVPAELLSRVHLSVSATTDRTRRLKPHLFWAHQSYDQPSVQNLKDPYVAATIDQFVFVSHWQQEQYERFLGVPRGKGVVVKNAIEPIPAQPKSTGPLKLIYTSTPFRGLDVLLDAFAALGRPDAELHIYSGMGLYGRPAEDIRFAELYARAKAIPNVQYHGVVSNDAVRQALQTAHIFAYPSTWEETSCLSLIEALSAGCLAVTPNLAALPETASGYARLYPFATDKRAHAERFAAELDRAISAFWQPALQQRLSDQQRYFDEHYSWQRRKGEWEQLLQQIISASVYHR